MHQSEPGQRKFARNLIGNLLRAIKDDILHSETFSQIFGTLGLSLASRGCEGRSKFNMKSSCDDYPASIGQKCDNQTRCCINVFVAIDEGRVDLLNDAVV